MRFCRYMTTEGVRYGVVENVDGVDTITKTMPSPQLMVNQYGVPDAVQLAGADKFEDVKIPTALDLAVTLIPFPVVSKIVCVGRNYGEHAKELGNEVPKSPLIFLKPPSALLAPHGEIRRPAALSQRVDFEGELGVVIGRTCRKLTEADNVRDYILGYTCVNDVTARDLQKTDGQWSRAKGFDTFCPVGPLIATDIDPWAGVAVSTKVNGRLQQQGSTSQFIFDLGAIIRHISQVMTLLPGDLIATGTPAGVGPLESGDVVEVTVEGIGTLINPVIND